MCHLVPALNTLTAVIKLTLVFFTKCLKKVKIFTMRVIKSVTVYDIKPVIVKD